MDEKELVQWMRVVDQRLARLEVQGDATPGAPDLPDVDSGRLDALIPKPLTWQQIAGAFSKRYESTRGLAWHYGPHVQALEDVAAWVNKQSGDTKSVAVRLLDAFFANNYAATRDFPPKLLASQ